MYDSYDLTIVGSGVAGLMVAKKAASLGMRTLLLERNNRVAGGSSTRNEGWLHAGTYHAISIKDRDQAAQVATRALYGHQQLRMYAPEAIEGPLMKTLCLVRENEVLEEILERWNSSSVSYQAVQKDYFFDKNPVVRRDGVTHVFEVADVSINTRMLYAKLLHEAQLYGATVWTQAELTFDENRRPVVVHQGKRKALQSKLFVYTAGYSAGKILHRELGVELPLRYWKSHLLIVPKLTEQSVFNLSPGEAALMNHQYCSIVGFNEDAYVVAEPNTVVEHGHVSASLEAFQRLLHTPRDLRYVPVSCVKVDVPEQLSISRSLNVNVIEPIPGHIFAFPGKMTETPYLVDVLMQIVFERLDDCHVSFRPCDDAKSVLFCKEGVEFDGPNVVKKHHSEKGANLESLVARLYSGSAVRDIKVPKYKGVFVRDGKHCLLMENVIGRTALGHDDFSLAERLIGDLAIFHHMFSQHGGANDASVLYRDSIPSNVIITPEGNVVHIDFSSSDRFVHAWDDVALLLNPAWSTLNEDQREELVTRYIQFREEFAATSRIVAQLSKQPENQEDGQRREYYIDTTRRMLATGLIQEVLLEQFNDVDFRILRREDFGVFKSFRTLRANFYKQKIWRNK